LLVPTSYNGCGGAELLVPLVFEIVSFTLEALGSLSSHCLI